MNQSNRTLLVSPKLALAAEEATMAGLLAEVDAAEAADGDSRSRMAGQD